MVSLSLKKLVTCGVIRSFNHWLFFPINFNSTALFKKAFFGLDLAGKPFGGDFEQLSPCKMKKTNVPHS